MHNESLGAKPTAQLLSHWKLPNQTPAVTSISTWKSQSLLAYAPKPASLILPSFIWITFLINYVWSSRASSSICGLSAMKVASHEAVTNSILDDLVAATQPKFMRVTAKFYVRGGIFTNVVAEHRQAGWQPQPKVDLLQFSAQSQHSRLI